jgi:sulfur carrier protein
VSEAITVRLNGEEREVPVGRTLHDLLVHLGQDPRTVAVEHNGTVVPRGRFAEALVADGDRIEVVRFVQGG